VLFSDSKDRLKCVYKWHPLIIGDIATPPQVRLPDTHAVPTPPCFQFLRGSTHGIKVDDEIWFICHLVSYEDRRYYYHVFVAIDAETYQFRRFLQVFHV
jgi:hypothetical protein